MSFGVGYWSRNILQDRMKWRLRWDRSLLWSERMDELSKHFFDLPYRQVDGVRVDALIHGVAY